MARQGTLGILGQGFYDESSSRIEKKLAGLASRNHKIFRLEGTLKWDQRV